MKCFIWLALIVTGSVFRPSDANSNANAGDVAALDNQIKATPVFKAPGIVWGFDFLSENEVLMSLRNGTILFLDLKTNQSKPIGLVPVFEKGQGGLLDLKVHRSGGKTWIYLTASIEAASGEPASQPTGRPNKETQTTGLFRGEWKAGKIEGLAKIFEASPPVDSPYHFGSRLVFPKTGGLFMSVGERNERERAQDLSQHWGKILRLTLDGKPHPANPYASGSTKIAGVLPRPEIYSYGHRNPQGLALDPVTDQLYNSEHGPQGGDEINFVQAGVNYGWPIITYGKEYSGPVIGTTAKPGLEQPRKYYVPSIAPSSLLIARGTKHKVFEGLFLQGALKLQHLNVTDIKTGKEARLFANLKERFRNVVHSPAGEIFASTDEGNLYRLDSKK